MASKRSPKKKTGNSAAPPRAAVPQRRERVLPRLIEDEMRESFLNYSMSVIVQRALPDVRDGLKPVHRRILYAMHEMGLAPARPYKKSASVVGEVLGKFHPHGDMAVYDAMVRMVQDFSLRYPLIDGQGNFGSIDGDNAAAYRYTEARLSAPAVEMLADIDKDTVAFTATFDSQREEPVILPALLPNLLVNGSSGIAVGMSTNVPPHNLREVASALKHMIAKPDCSIDDLMKHVPGPDFPTGGYILGIDGIRDAYHTGRGRMIMRARVQKEAKRGGKDQLVFTELPYGVSKSRVIEQIAELARERKIEDISDLRDESDRDGMRIVVELKRGAKIRPILNYLFKQTHLQATFGAIMLALMDGVPREFNLKEMLEHYRDHRLNVIVKRSEFDLRKAREEAHIVEGLIIALDNIDAVIRIIRRAKDREEAAKKLVQRFELTQVQADAILNMRLVRLTALETKELKDRLKVLEKLIADLEKLLSSRKRQLKVLVDELDAVVEKYGDARRTSIVRKEIEAPIEHAVAHESVVITVSHQGYVKRMPMSLYRRRASSGKQLAGMEKYDDDFLEHAFVASTQETMLIFTNDGFAHALPVADIPETGGASRGKALAQLLAFSHDEGIAALVSVSDFPADRYVIFLTAEGAVKRTALDQFAKIRSGGIIAINLRDGDGVLDAKLSDGTNDVVLVTLLGRAIRFPEEEIPPMGRATQGVRGIQLRDNDKIAGMVVTRRDAMLCTVTEQGFAKRTRLDEYPLQRRGGVGTTTVEISKKTGLLVGVKEILVADEVMLVTVTGAAHRVPATKIPIQGRLTQGKRIIDLEKKDRVVEVARVAPEQEESSSPVSVAVDEEEDLALPAQLELIASAGE